MKKPIIVLALAFVLLLVGAGALYTGLSQANQPQVLATAPTQTTASSIPSSSTSATEENPYLAPDFTVYDLDGNEVKLSDFFGKPIVLNFWASWCGPCKSEMPDFEAAYLEMVDEIHFLMVNMTDGRQETVDSAFAYIQEQGFTFPVYYDTAYSAAMTYGVTSLPTTYFIDAEGSLVTYAYGAINAELLQKGIGMITQ